MLRGMFVPPALSQTRFPHLSRAGKEFRTCFLGPKIALSTRDVLPRRLVALLHGPLRGPPTARKVPRGMFVLPALLQTRLPPLFRAGKGLSHMLPWSNMSETITRPLQSGLFTAPRQRGRRLFKTSLGPVDNDVDDDERDEDEDDSVWTFENNR